MVHSGEQFPAVVRIYQVLPPVEKKIWLAHIWKSYQYYGQKGTNVFGVQLYVHLLKAMPSATSNYSRINSRLDKS